MKKIVLMAIMAAAAVSVSFGQGICECQKDCRDNYKSKNYNNSGECMQQECGSSRMHACVKALDPANYSTEGTK